MYKRTYGTKSNYSTSNRTVRTSNSDRFKSNRGRYSRSSFTPLFSSVSTYGPPRRRPRPSERDNRILRRDKSEERSREEKPEKSDEDEPKPKPKPPVRQPTPEPPPAEEEEIVKVLHVKKVELHIEENVKAHRTDKYEITEAREDADGNPQEAELVIRRGQKFKMTITCDRPYDKEKHDLTLMFRTGNNPRRSRKTLARMKLDESGAKPDEADEWAATLKSWSDNDIVIDVYSSAETVIGEWEFSIETYVYAEDKDKDKTKIMRYNHPDDISILLNAWCEDDQCYLPTTKLLDEYVLCEQTTLWRGNYKQIGAKPWNVGQFEEGILDASFHLLRKAFGGRVDQSMSDPIKISRAISRIINNCDDAGVLVGNWSGDYDGGTKPTAWAGSVKILKQYMKEGEPVKFGQCWVFSAVTLTVCRALGLPCRSVTNFASAHDSDGSVTIDYMWERNDKGKLMKKKHYFGDSVWNFHVWNEVWMNRPDLPPGYDGWQIIDATPQETSEGAFCCGPASLAAVKKGECTLPYDTPFVFAEVNADRVHQEYLSADNFKIFKIETDAVGKKISTKLPTGRRHSGFLSLFTSSSDREREDLTLAYKHEEGSSRERKAVINANKAAKKLENRPDVYEKKLQDIEMTLEDVDGMMVGDPFEVTLTVKNRSNETRTLIDIAISANVVTYVGQDLDDVKSQEFDEVVLKPKGEETFKMKVTAEDYLEYLVEQASMKTDGTARVKETDTACVATGDFRLRRPDLTVSKSKEHVKVKETVDVTVSFWNPLPVPLTKCVLTIEGPGLLEAKPEQQPDVPAKSEWKATVTMKPRRPGPRQVIASFDSDQLTDITGYCNVDVAK